MFYVYLIKSKKDGRCYTGSTPDLKRRFIEHNKGLVRSTAPLRPFTLVYYEAYRSEKDARLRESRLKDYKRAYNQLRKRIENSLKD
jgi:putative endonuclease